CFDRARAVYESAVLANPCDAVAHDHLGLVHLVAQRLPQAMLCFERALFLRPDFAFAHYSLGLALQSAGRHDEAGASYRRAVALAPHFGDAQAKLGDLLYAASERTEALACFRRASAADPQSTLARLNEAKILLDADDFAAAEQCLRQAIALDPSNTELHRALGVALRPLGRFAEAIACFEQALALDPWNTAAALGLVQSKKLTLAERDFVEQLEAALRIDGATDRDRINLHFALGKAFDDLGEDAAAISHVDEGNRLMRQSISFDHAAHKALIDRTIAAFTADFISRHAALGCHSELPVFVVGMMRSGTTLVERILARHPDLRPGGELPFWGERAAELARAGPGGITAAATQSVILDYLALLETIAPDSRRVVDKMPHNFLLIGLIHWLFPEARIIHCRRHPVDTALSIYFTLFDRRHDFAYDRADIVAYYRNYARLMAHWRAILPSDRFLELDYEALVADPEGTARRLVAFCGLDWHEACARPETSQHIVKTASAWQARQPITAASVARWRRYEPWLGAFAELLQAEDSAAASS
ncbi:MAG: sulfotransferase, partial [Alphaproteobacteria bacterium]|nr:sulfotransferase [Alphaproteobacteria bacterium]